jgi:cellulose synthase/poly-beta-1,6-N-acetylglucosamine synthase-like glycosyltransferase
MAGRDDRVRLVRCSHRGKAAALNAALATVSGPLVATIDADALVTPSSLSRAVGRLLSMPDDTAAVAGAVMVRDSRAHRLRGDGRGVHRRADGPAPLRAPAPAVVKPGLAL